MFKKIITPLALISVANIIIIAVFSQFAPNEIPLQLGITENINLTGKTTLIISSTIPLFIELAFAFFPPVVPDDFRSVFSDIAGKIIKTILILLIMLNNLHALLQGYSTNISVNSLQCFTIGVLIIIISLYFGNLKFRFPLGINNLWTINNETVWHKTHFFANYFITLIGFNLILIGLINNNILNICLPIIIIIAFISIYFYSYQTFKKHNKKRNKTA